MTKVPIRGTCRWGGLFCTPAPSLPVGLQQGPVGAIAVPSPPEHSLQASCHIQHHRKTGHCDCTASSPAPGSPCSHRQCPFACAWPWASSCTAGCGHAPFTSDSVPRSRPSSGCMGSVGERAESSGLGRISAWLSSAHLTNSPLFFATFSLREG